MAPNADATANSPKYYQDDDIVISGISGRFPNCDTFEEFKKKLFDGTDILEKEQNRWPEGICGAVTKIGVLNNLTKFDSTFFNVHPKLAERLDPQIRCMLESTYEAFVDAGVNPTSLRGSNTAVVVATTNNDYADWWSADPTRVNGYEFLGVTRTMFPNRISYSFDLKGPSYALDSGSSGSLVAFEHAYRMLKTGVVDGVVVAGCSLLLNPVLSVMLQKMNGVSPDGKSRPFDVSGQGTARSDAVVIAYLQHAKNAKRVYATAVSARTNTEGFRLEGAIYPSNTQQIELFREALDIAKINPTDVDYIESSACGDQLGDAQELNAVTEVYCKDRTKPLLIGSVKSNMGDSEPASGICGIVKTVLAMERQEIPPTLHYKAPNPRVPALKDGRLLVVNKSLPWKGKYAAVNAVGVGGHNAHALLKANEKQKQPKPQDSIPRLVVGSARTESAINYLLNTVEGMPRDPEFYGLLYGVHSQNIPGHIYRGYSILDEKDARETAVLGVGKRQVWYVFSGMGSQWTGMGRDLLALPPFRESIDKSANTLKNLGLDLYAIFNSNDKTIFDNVLNSFVGIAAIQIALVDVLTTVGITPDGIVGHSVGELACAYADGTLTAEQTIIVAYWRGRSLLDLNLAPGAMAAVGLSWEEANARVPSDIAVACHNSEDGVTISGPPDSIAKFVDQLKSEGVFAREVNSSGIAFHSWYIAAAGPLFKEKVAGIISKPIMRSVKWISTSIPESRWDEPLAQYSSVAYHVNNLVSPVLFNSALKHIPDNSVVIEIAPHALLQAILKPSVGSKCTHVGLVRRNHSTVVNLLSSIGNLYNAGLHPKIENLYPQINYPVSKGTPSLQNLVEWDHADDWEVITFIDNEVKSSGEVILNVDTDSERYNYLRGTYIDGVEVLPYASYLTFVWDAFAKLQRSFSGKVPVVFDNVQFFKVLPIPESGKFCFTINILESSGEFEIRESNSVVVSGFIHIQTSDEQVQLPEIKSYEVDQLSTADVYQELACKGYKYSKSFQGINLANDNGNCGRIVFDGKWAPFIESLLQLHLLKLDTRDHYAIKYLFKLSIYPEKQHASVSSNSTSFSIYENIGVIKSAGVEIRDIRSTLVPIRKELQQDFDLESYVFLPFVSDEVVDEPLKNIVQIVLENAYEPFEVSEVLTSSQQEHLVPKILSLINAKSSFYINAHVYAKDVSPYQSEEFITYYEQDLTSSDLEKQSFFVVANGAIENKQLLNNVLSGVQNGGFLLSIEHQFDSKFRQVGLDVVAKYTDGQNLYILFKKNTDAPTPVVLTVGNSFSWVELLKQNIQNAKNDNRDVFLISQNLENTGVIGLTKGLRQEPNGKFVKCVSIKDNKAPLFSVSLPLYQEQLRKGLAVNMLLGGVWGTCAFVPYKKTKVQVEHAYINTTKAGDVNSLQYIEGKLSTFNPKENPDYDLYYPYCVPLNGLDVKMVKGTIQSNGISEDIAQQGSYLGMEFAGRNANGKKVIGLVSGGALATSVLARKDLVWEVPDSWSMEAACTVPRTYSLAYYALVVRGNVQSGESVYVHAGASGISTAAISVALELGAIPYVGVFNKDQVEYLKTRFPQLNNASFADLASGSFEQHLLEQTEGQGVDLIFDTYSAYDKRQEFVNSLAEYGRLVDFEVFAPISDSLGVSGNLKSITYSKISFSTIQFSPSEIQYIQRLVEQGIRNNKVQPLETVVFPASQVAEAFKYNANCSNNLGRIVIKIREEEDKVNVPSTKITVAASPKLFYTPEKVFVVSGDEDSLSLELIQHLAHRGARKFVLVSKMNNKPQSGYKTLTLKRLKNKNVNVILSFADPSTVKGAEDVLKEAVSLGTVCGIFYITTAPETKYLQSLSEKDFAATKKAVSEAVANLDTLSRRLIPQLESFVVLAPAVASRGAKAKSDYVFANADVFRVAEVRKISGYPTAVIEYGAIEGSSNAFNSPNFKPSSIVSALNVLDEIVKQPLNSTVVSYSKFNGPNSEELDAATPLLSTIARIFGFKKLSDIEQTYNLAQLGLDTLIAPRIQEAIRQQANINIEVEELRKMTFPALRAKFIELLA
ncbi:fatty acid synthase-like [Melanaphis sacchari]|uniref:fatty acid synthase-like n=1 Tax=Melanaphis sacchari TaxID=742174 RepID=UPI000DC155D1|nr:fatty acid synthase-like [Melanaphis sacchari]